MRKNRLTQDDKHPCNKILTLLQDNETWELVPFPSKRKRVQCKWVYGTKVATYGYHIKYNSMLVSKCFYQFKVVDYIDTFAPFAKMDSIRLVLAFVASKL